MQPSRLQLALNVSDLDEAVAFYTKLFGVAPQKERAGYANFAVADPPLKLVLFESGDAGESLNHLGVELADSQQVGETATRLHDAGLATRASEQETCCHATQDKVYVHAPDVPLGFWGECCGDTAEREACCA